MTTEHDSNNATPPHPVGGDAIGEDAETLRVDTRGRINVGQWARPGSSWIPESTDQNTLILRRAVVMPKAEFAALTARLTQRPVNTDTAPEPERQD